MKSHTPNGYSLPVKYGFSIPNGVYAFQEPCFLSPFLRELENDTVSQSKKLICPYNEFTFSLGALIFILITLKSDPPSIDLKQAMLQACRDKYLPAGFSRFLRELVCENSSKRMSFKTAAKIMQHIMLKDKHMKALEVVSKLQDLM